MAANVVYGDQPAAPVPQWIQQPHMQPPAAVQAAPVPAIRQEISPQWVAECVPQPGQWTTSICACCTPSFGSCCYAFWCPSCAFGDLNMEFNPADTVCCAGNFYGACCCHFWLGGVWSMALASLVVVGVLMPWPSFFQCCLTAPTRAAVRNKWNIPGNPCADCCVVYWCDGCSTNQEIREMMIRFTHIQHNTSMHPAMVQQPVVIQQAVLVTPPPQYHAPAPSLDKHESSAAPFHQPMPACSFAPAQPAPAPVQPFHQPATSSVTQFCESCGAAREASSAFCGRCGVSY